MSWPCRPIWKIPIRATPSSMSALASSVAGTLRRLAHHRSSACGATGVELLGRVFQDQLLGSVRMAIVAHDFSFLGEHGPGLTAARREQHVQEISAAIVRLTGVVEFEFRPPDRDIFSWRGNAVIA